MQLHEMRGAISDARRTLDNADEVATSLAYILEGRLRQIPSYVAANLKRELKDLNAHTGKWKGEE